MTLIIVTNLFANGVEIDGIHYVFQHDSAIVTYQGSETFMNNNYAGDIVIPEYVTYENRKYIVRKIGLGAFYDCANLTSITLPTVVGVIDNKAFCGCSKLRSINLSNVHSIGAYAFQECAQLDSIKLAMDLTILSYGIFYGCSNLTTIDFRETRSLETIEPYAFGECRNIKEFNFSMSSHNITDIQAAAFINCTSLSKFEVPDHVYTINEYVFLGCTNLSSVTFLTFRRVQDNMILGVTEIKQNAFEDCTKLTRIKLPETLSIIGDEAFSGCINLDTIQCDAVNPPICGWGTFDFVNVEKITPIVPSESIVKYQTAPVWEDFNWSIHTTICPPYNTLTIKKQLQNNILRIYTNSNIYIVNGCQY